MAVLSEIEMVSDMFEVKAKGKGHSLVVAIPVSKPKRNVPIAANSAIPKVYQRPIFELSSKTTTIVKD